MKGLSDIPRGGKMKNNSLVLMVCLILIFFSNVTQGSGAPMARELAIFDELNEASKEKIVEEVARLITKKYVFPDIGEKIATYILDRFKEKAYDRITKLRPFTEALTQDLRSVSKDAHLGIVERRGPFKKGVSPEEMYKTLYLKRAPFRNYGFIKAERMLGNVGCLVIDEFTYVDMDGKNVGGETAKAAMTLVSQCYALIIDLRDNFGGREEMALLLLSYMFDNPVHILTKSYRDEEDKEIWTYNNVSQGNLGEIPLYVLTSQHTVSGGEMFAYVLKNRKRATLIGEKTRGAAHKTHLFSLEDFNIDVAIPTGKTFDPLTQTDWEGKGVEPDIIIASGKAMDVAYEAALQKLISSKVERSERQEMEWALMEAQARLNPISLDESALKEFVGKFGIRRITIEKDTLIYQKEGNPAYELSPMTKDLFSFTDKSMFYVRVKFERDESGAVNKIVLLYDTGQKDESQKTGE
jgi:C-terminal processing protease CtpA/Prc